MEAEPRCIEIKLISCKDLRAFNFFQKLTLYALVFIDDPKRDLTEEQKQTQRTQTDRHQDSDGCNPEWNHHARFDLGFLSLSQRYSGNDNDLFLHFEFRHDGVILGDKLIGECRVPLADLIRDADADAAARFVSYEVRSGEGKPNGIFNFSYRLKGFGIGIGSGSGTHSSQILEGRISGYPILAPEDCASCAPNQTHVPYPVVPTCDIDNTCCYPTVPLGSAVYTAAVPPPPPPGGEFHCYYPPPPPQPPVVYPYPPPPPPVVHAYPPHFGPPAHPWHEGPYYDRRW